MIVKRDGKAVRRGLVSGNSLEADPGVRPSPISYFSIGKRQAAPADRRFHHQGASAAFRGKPRPPRPHRRQARNRVNSFFTKGVSLVRL